LAQSPCYLLCRFAAWCNASRQPLYGGDHLLMRVALIIILPKFVGKDFHNAMKRRIVCAAD